MGMAEHQFLGLYVAYYSMIAQRSVSNMKFIAKKISINEKKI